MGDSFGFRGNQPINSALFNTRHNTQAGAECCTMNPGTFGGAGLQSRASRKLPHRIRRSFQNRLRGCGLLHFSNPKLPRWSCLTSPARFSVRTQSDRRNHVKKISPREKEFQGHHHFKTWFAPGPEKRRPLRVNTLFHRCNLIALKLPHYLARLQRA
jgi:hypothetical protein